MASDTETVGFCCRRFTGLCTDRSLLLRKRNSQKVIVVQYPRVSNELNENDIEGSAEGY